MNKYCKDCQHWKGDYIKDLLKKCEVKSKGVELVDGSIFASAPFYTCEEFKAKRTIKTPPKPRPTSLKQIKEAVRKAPPNRITASALRDKTYVGGKG